ncbi:KpsF/GutQ family sugar-phosphate isomerase [Aureimonas frigidaquae]|uniref:KpsF/GutQ family protein n=1 Tax=Aureimonas frigidaquae TaxID=424757 RepID=A0A0P0Z2B9_9HYPH|nr:KpsF/GutQ family sugar-phosphate isomerase [Aureimonas frigidaquae]BAT28222.1 KpsF/GutQ family protein [Aureimonas frigidaquae]
MTTGRAMREELAPDAIMRMLDSGKQALSTELAGLTNLVSAMSGDLGEAFTAVAQVITRIEGRVIVSGMGKSGHIGRKIAATLASTGTPSFFMHPGEASHGDLGMVTERDAVLAISWSGETVELKDLVTYCNRHQVPLIALTSQPNSALGRAANHCLIMPRSKEACPHGLAPTTSTLMQLAMGDALAVALLEARQFTPANFRTYHPGGKLGSALLTVADIMRPASRIETVGPDADMGTAIIAMSTLGLGCVVVADEAHRVLGIVTDGDLRRHMQDNLTSLTVESVMSTNPLTVSPTMLAASALATMTQEKVASLIVSDNDKLIGVVTTHMMLSRGLS